VTLDDEEARQSRRTRHEQELARLLALSDGVFAIAITLLVLQLTVPEISGRGIGSQLAGQLLSAVPKIVTYCIGFAVIALFWLGHRRVFFYIVRSDAVLTFLNLGLLLCVAFMPFPTAILSLYGETAVAVIFYTSTLTVAGLLNLVLWLWAASGHRLIRADVSDRLIRNHSWRACISPAVFLASMPLALWSPTIAEMSWLSILVISVVFRRVLGVEEAHPAPVSHRR
jgi:uncharacterized membrane protein